jgi:hypothetical protein
MPESIQLSFRPDWKKFPSSPSTKSTITMSQRKAGEVYYSKPSEGCTETEIIRVAQLIGFGQSIHEIRDLYVKEGKPVGDATLAYLAGKTYLKIQGISNREFSLQRQNTTPTRQEMRAVRI